MYISIDIGGTTTRIAANHSLEEILLNKRYEFRNTHDFKKDFASVIQGIKNISEGKVDAIGIGITGDPNDEKTLIVSAQNIPEWVNQPIKQRLIEEFECPVFLDNDGPVSALGEGMYGNQSKDDFVYVIWGTGIGGASVKYYQNHVKSEMLDWYKYFERWEENCGGAKIIEKYGKSGAELNEEEWNTVMKVFEEELTKFTEKLSPQKIVFGGGISIKQEPRLMKLAKKFLGVEIFPSVLGEETGIYGGFALLKNSL